MGRLLAIFLLFMPLIEIAGFVLVGSAIGLWWTLAAVMLAALLGGILLRYQGMAVLNEIRTTMNEGRMPARAIADGMLIGIAALLLVIPGFFSDLVGLLLLIPPVRTLIYALLASRMTVVSATASTAYRPQRPGEIGTIIELDDEDWRER